jgi:hypothetical protein
MNTVPVDKKEPESRWCFLMDLAATLVRLHGVFIAYSTVISEPITDFFREHDNETLKFDTALLLMKRHHKKLFSGALEYCPSKYV